MARKNLFLILIIFFLSPAHCYEKTLRKIVRNHQKMVQRPFSDDDNGGNIVWMNISRKAHNVPLMPSGYAQVKTLLHSMQRPKMSTIFSSVESAKGKSTYSKMKMGRNEHFTPIELRLARNTFNNITMAIQTPTEDSVLFQPHMSNTTSYASYLGEISVEPFYQIPTRSALSPALGGGDLTNIDQKTNAKDQSNIAVVIPTDPAIEKNNDTAIVKGIFIADTGENEVQPVSEVKNTIDLVSENDETADFLLEEVSPDERLKSIYNYSKTINPYTCTIILENNADINTQAQFSKFDIEPSWVNKKHYWNHVFDSRYESLMRNPKWPPLQVILVPFSRVDSIWKRPFELCHNNTVNKIILNIVKKLQFYTNMTFTWNEVSHLSQWWKKASRKNRTAFRKLLKSGRLEITTGGWVETDEATSHLFGLLHQLIEGHQWLKNNLNYTPKVGWLTNSVTHSSTLPYLLSACGISNFVLTNLHYSWEQFLAEFQMSDFIWVQNWDHDKNSVSSLNKMLNKIGNERYSKNSVLTHILPFNSDSILACGPNKNICADYDFMKTNKHENIQSYNIKLKSEMLLEQYSKAGTLSPHNVIIAPIGGPYRFESQTEFDYQYNNYQKIADFINFNTNIYTATIKFGTPKDYFNSVLKKHKSYPSIQGDFLNFADTKSGRPAYWSGFFTSRPLLKIFLQRLQSTLRTSEILLTFSVNFDVFSHHNVSRLFEILTKSRESVARLQDRHVVGGTLNKNSVQYVYKQILKTIKDCWHIQEVATSLLTSKPDNRSIYLHKLVYREGEFISSFRTVGPGDQMYVFNSLSQERTEVVELISKQANIRIVDHNKKDLTIQVNPVWSHTTANKLKISSKFFKIIFVVIVPPMTLELFKIKETYDATHSLATIYCSHCFMDNFDKSLISPFTLIPLQPGDIQLESYKHRIIIDEYTGFLKSVVEKETNTEKTVIIDFGAFRSADKNAGIFLFNTNVTRPLDDILLPFRNGTKNRLAIIVAGEVNTEMTTVFGSLLEHTVKLYNLINSPLANSIYLVTKLDYEVSPKNRELEVFLSIKTDITNGNHPRVYTDNNGFQYTLRTLNISRRIESNVYPITNMAYIQDSRSRLTILTDHAQGITALQEGQLVVMLDRRILFDDGRGTHEGLADNSDTYHRHYILLENFIDSSNSYHSQSELQLPSFSAAYMANSIHYNLELFLINKKSKDASYYSFLPLIKTSFPCDVAVINFRTILNKSSQEFLTPNAALLILQRQGISCRIENSAQHCNGDTSFFLEKILRNVHAVFRTNLVGTNTGSPLPHISQENFPPMDIMTLKILF